MVVMVVSEGPTWKKTILRSAKQRHTVNLFTENLRQVKRRTALRTKRTMLEKNLKRLTQVMKLRAKRRKLRDE